MLIFLHGEMIEVPDNFLEPSYVFSAKRIRRIKLRSELSYPEFARVYDISHKALVSWISNRRKGHTNHPCPAARVKLAFIEASLVRNK